MIQTTVKINGMMCGMCESHVNDAIRNHFQVKKVNSSAKKNESVILSEEELPADELKQNGADILIAKPLDLLTQVSFAK